MKKHDLSGMNVAVLSHTEKHELCAQVCDGLKKQGAAVHVITEDGAMPHECEADEATKVEFVDSRVYRSLVVLADEQGGHALMQTAHADQFARSFFEAKKPVASNCWGTLFLGEAGLIEGRKVSISESLEEKAERYGARISREGMTVDNGFTTVSPRADLDDFIDKVVEEIDEGKHAGQRA